MYSWQATTKDGKEVKEIEGHSWTEIEKDIQSLSLVNSEGHTISLPDNLGNYIQAKTASADLNGTNIQIESRYIGFKLGNNTIRIRVDEKTNNISVEID
jgi:hypothetical protein